MTAPALALALAFALVATPAFGLVVVIAPHPDDAEASCGGLIANTVAAGESVVTITMTGGELAVFGKTPAEARTIREAEARDAAAVLGARVQFFGRTDGSLVADAASTDALRAVLASLRPRIVTAPWPLDVHPDHQAAGMLAWRVFQERSLGFDLYFYETSNSPHTISFGFTPTDYVDITAVLDRKREATLRHRTQHPQEWFGMYVQMATFRGYEADVPYAEAYVHARNSSGLGGRPARTGRNLPTW